MTAYLGIDTSNYTTSTALYFPHSCEVLQRKRPLPVKEGAIGLRQSDAVFGHVAALAGLLEELLADAREPVTAVGASVRPRDAEGSYMPCFLAGEMAARAAATAGIPFYSFSHQAGHIAAALFGAGRLDLLGKPFLAFHVSGGTTECLRVSPDGETVLAAEAVAESLDLHAGQAVDRVGAMLGLPFPAGPALEELAARSAKDWRPKPALKGADCCLSGVENQCRRLLGEGAPPEDVAKYCLCFLRETLLAMAAKARNRDPGLPLVWAGGVMSNRFLQAAAGAAYGDSCFAPPQYSADNAAGVAILCALRHRREGTPCPR